MTTPAEEIPDLTTGFSDGLILVQSYPQDKYCQCPKCAEANFCSTRILHSDEDEEDKEEEKCRRGKIWCFSCNSGRHERICFSGEPKAGNLKEQVICRPCQQVIREERWEQPMATFRPAPLGKCIRCGEESEEIKGCLCGHCDFVWSLGDFK